jgi:hypothetical protein
MASGQATIEIREANFNCREIPRRPAGGHGPTDDAGFARGPSLNAPFLRIFRNNLDALCDHV